MHDVLALLTLIVIGTMLANIIANPTGTKTVFDGLSSIWKTGVNGLLAKSSS